MATAPLYYTSPKNESTTLLPSDAELEAMGLTAQQFADIQKSVGNIDLSKIAPTGIGNLDLVGGTYSGPKLSESDYLYTAPKSNKGNSTSLIDTGGNTFAVMPGQEVRLVDTTTGKVVYQGVGKEGASSIIEIAAGLSADKGDKAGWEIQTGKGGVASEWGGTTGEGTPWTTVAKEKVNTNPAVQILSAAVQVGVAVATSGMSIPAQAAIAGGTAATLTLAQGGSLGDALKAGVMAAAPTVGAAKLGPMINKGLNAASPIVGKAIGAGISSTAAAALTGEDLGDALKAGAISAGTTAIMPDIKKAVKGIGGTSGGSSVGGAGGDIIVTAGGSGAGIGALPSAKGSTPKFEVPEEIIVTANQGAGIGALPSVTTTPKVTIPTASPTTSDEIIVTAGGSGAGIGALPSSSPAPKSEIFEPLPEEIIVEANKTPATTVTPTPPTTTPKPAFDPKEDIKVTGTKDSGTTVTPTPPTTTPKPAFDPKEDIKVTGTKDSGTTVTPTPPTTTPKPAFDPKEDINVTGTKDSGTTVTPTPPTTTPKPEKFPDEIVVTAPKDTVIGPPIDIPDIIDKPFDPNNPPQPSKKWTTKDWIRLGLLAPSLISGLGKLVSSGDDVGTITQDRSRVSYTPINRTQITPGESGAGLGKYGFDPFTYGQASGNQPGEYLFFTPANLKPQAQTYTPATVNWTKGADVYEYTPEQVAALNSAKMADYEKQQAAFNAYQNSLASNVESGAMTLDQAIAAANSYASQFGGASALPAAAEGGYIDYAEGGEMNDDMVRHLIEYRKGGGHYGPGAVKGIGSGQEDKIPAWLSDGEYVWSAQDVADLGDGSTDEGVRRLDKMRQMVRHRAGRKDVKKIAKPQKGIDALLSAVGGK